MRGFWADERVDGGLWKLKNPIYSMIYRFFKQKEKDFLQYSDGIISLTNAAKTEMMRWNLPEVNAEKIDVIPCAADFDLFKLIFPENL